MAVIAALSIYVGIGLWLTAPFYWTSVLILWGVLRWWRRWLEVSSVASAVAAYAGVTSSFPPFERDVYTTQMYVGVVVAVLLWAGLTIGIAWLLRCWI